MKEISRPSRDKLALENTADVLYSRLSTNFLHINPEKNTSNFQNDFLAPMLKLESEIGDEILDEFKRNELSDKSRSMQSAPIIISCAYFTQALKAMKNGNRELAWSYMTDASYWCGVLMASQGIEVAREKTISSTKKNTAKQGGLARTEGKYRKLMEEAYRLAKDERPEKNGWKSRLHAARTITPMMLVFSKNLKEPLSDNQAEKTIYEWLKDMPEAAKYFPRKSSTPQKR